MLNATGVAAASQAQGFLVQAGGSKGPTGVRGGYGWLYSAGTVSSANLVRASRSLTLSC